MYVYNYRLFDRYDRLVASLAVLGDERAGWRPERFGFAMVVMAHLKAQETRGEEEERKNVIYFELDNVRYELTRLDDCEYHKLWEMSVPIKNDYGFEMSFSLYLIRQGHRLNLAQLYTALKHLCGESSASFDDWKSSFFFPFSLDISREIGQFAYLFNIGDYRGGLDYGIRKIVEPDDNRYDRRVIHQPFENEFSREEINYLIAYFYHYLLGFFEVIKDRHHEFFFKQVQSNLLLFGYRNGTFFEEQYYSPEEYEQAVKAIRAYPKTLPQAPEPAGG